MGTAYVKDAPPLVDLGECHDVFLSGLASIERLPGNCLRFVWYVEETDDGQKRRRVAQKAIVPLDVMPLAMAHIADALARFGEAILAEDGGLRLVN